MQFVSVVGSSIWFLWNQNSECPLSFADFHRCASSDVMKNELRFPLTKIARIRFQPFVRCLTNVTFTKGQRLSCPWISGGSFGFVDGLTLWICIARNNVPKKCFLLFESCPLVDIEQDENVQKTFTVLFCLYSLDS